MTAALKLMTLDPMGRRAEWARLNRVRESRKDPTLLVAGAPKGSKARMRFYYRGESWPMRETWERNGRVVCLTGQPLVDDFFLGSGPDRLLWLEGAFGLRCRVRPPGIAWFGDFGPERRTMLVEIWRADAAPDFDV